MSIKDSLAEAAAQIAERLTRKDAELQKRSRELQFELKKIETQRDFAGGAAKRLLDFHVTVGTDYQCPNCWISEGVHHALYPVPSTNSDDIMRCGRCGFDFTIDH